MDDDSASHEVELYIYDLTQGMARMMSQMLLGIYYNATTTDNPNNILPTVFSYDHLRSTLGWRLAYRCRSVRA